jgi:serine/threonine protein kinase
MNKPPTVETDRDNYIIQRRDVAIESTAIIGRGSFGTVRLGTFRSMKVAVKSLRRISYVEKAQDMLRREARNLVKIRHPALTTFMA